MQNENKIRQFLVQQNIIQNDSKETYLVRCPFHNEHNGTSLRINFSQNVFKCFSGKCIPNNIKGKLWYLCKLLGYELEIGRFEYKPIKTTIKAINEQRTIDTNIEEYDLYHAQQYHTKNYQYLLSRKIPFSISAINQCSYSDYFKRVYIPFWQDKTCFGMIGRSILKTSDIEQILKPVMENYQLGFEAVYNMIQNNEYFDDTFDKNYKNILRTKFWFRYFNNFGLQKEKLVFEPLSNANRDVLLITEGQINAMYANVAEFDANAILGSYPSDVQINRIRNNAKGKQLILAFDNDLAGFNNVAKFREKYGQLVARINFKKLLNFRNDLNDCSIEEIKYMVENLTYM